jgi:electron transfer flavoprotein beta subunit
MKILVPVKRTLDANVKVRIAPDQSGFDLGSAKMAMNPFCEIAVEEALRLREAGHASEVIAVTIGDAKSDEQLRTALALGADRAVRIQVDNQPEPLHVAKLLKELVNQEQPGLIILGKQSIDTDNNQAGQMLAALTGYSLATFASKVEVDGDKVVVSREVDGGEQVLKLSLPAVVTTDLRLNEPRYVKLPDIMKARKKTIDTIDADELGVDLTPRIQVLSVKAPESDKQCEFIQSAAELVSRLREKEQVI